MPSLYAVPLQGVDPGALVLLRLSLQKFVTDPRVSYFLNREGQGFAKVARSS